ncbi:hypothetical protein FHR88_000545 [Bradyrhizobium betae]|nr:hypothetical protein [Bradyrhizobium betae]
MRTLCIIALAVFLGVGISFLVVAGKAFLDLYCAYAP